MAKAKSHFHIYMVEDDIWYGEILEYHLSLNEEYTVTRFETGKDLLKALNKRPDVITVDFSLPDIAGKELIAKVRSIDNSIPIVVVSGQEDVKVALELMKEPNVADYIVKDSETKDRLWLSMLQIRERESLKDEISHLKDELTAKYAFQNMIIGESDSIKRVYKLMQKACDNNITVSITGETGTGKELVAKCIHYNSERAKKPYITVNMSAIPKELIESELFGHEKGAFTGAVNARIGKFEEAHGGTIFLDEIAEMDVSLQAKMLRVLQEREVTKVGGNKSKSIDVRIIVATHKNLQEEVQKGNFREDLYYRVLGLPIELPPLRDRGNDTFILAKHFMDEFCKANKKPKVKLSDSAKKALKSHPFKGNVRELKASVELACVMAENDCIEESDFNFNTANSMSELLSSEKTLKEYNAQIIRHFLQKYNDDIAAVADRLDVGKSTLYRMIKNKEV